MSYPLGRPEAGWWAGLRAAWAFGSWNGEATPAASPGKEEVRTASGMHGWLLVVLMTATLTLYHFRHRWPLYLLIPLGAYIILAVLIPRLRRTAPRLEVGRLDAHALGLVVVFSLASAALFVLVCEVYYHISFIGFAQQLPRWSPVLVVLVCLIGSLVNSCLEELIWRGVVYGAFAAQLSISLAIILQAIGFAFEHMFFIPVPWLGICMAFIFGIILGWLRYRTGGLGAAVLTHWAMDLTLMGLVLTYWF